MRFIVYGAGAIGSVLGARLHLAGHDVALIARPNHAQAISDEGLLLRTSKARTRVPIPAYMRLTEASLGGLDAVFLTTKSCVTTEAANEFTAHLPPGTPVICCQNGIRNEAQMLRRWPSVCGGLVLFDATLLGPGDVIWTGDDRLGIGRYPEGANRTAERIADAFEGTGLRARAMANVMAGKRRKLFSNLNNAVYTLLDIHEDEALHDAEVRALLADVMEEGWRALSPILPPLEEADTFEQPSVPDAVASLRAPDFDPPPLHPLPEFRVRASTAQDFDHRRGSCEARWFNGEAVAASVLTRVPVPLNDTLLRLVETRAHKRAPPGGYRVADLRRLAAQS